MHYDPSRNGARSRPRAGAQSSSDRVLRTLGSRGADVRAVGWDYRAHLPPGLKSGERGLAAYHIVLGGRARGGLCRSRIELRIGGADAAEPARPAWAAHNEDADGAATGPGGPEI